MNINKIIENLDSRPIPDSKVFENLRALLEYLGSNDSKEREETYKYLNAYFRQGLCPETLHLDLLNILISDNFVFYEIDNAHSTVAIKRSFACLVIESLLYANIKGSKRFSEADCSRLLKTLMNYWKNEKNTVGLESSLGWVHCHAHLFDALKTLFHHPNLPNEDIEIALGLFLNMTNETKNIFASGEETRLARALHIIILTLGQEKSLACFESHNIDNYVSAGEFPTNLRLTYLALLLILDRSKFSGLAEYFERFVFYR